VRGPTATRAPERRGPAGPRERRSFAEPRRAATSSSWIAQAERRGPLALAIAVGILVIAALVTMSYLLRGP